jgi:hypothetical protein
MLLAQGLGEYGMLVGGKAASDGSSSKLRDVVEAVENFIQHATPTQWAMIGGGLFLLWFIFLRRR